MNLKQIIYGFEERGYLGPCAKQRVICRIIATDGEVFMGENKCASPQEICPRLPDEDYKKCKSICKQVAHAEEVALCYAGDKAKEATVTIEGHSRICDECEILLSEADVKEVVFL